MLVGTAVWATLPGVLRLLGFPPAGYAIISVVLASVGCSLVLFRKLGRPLTVSLCSGAVTSVLSESILRIIRGRSVPQDLLGLLLAGALAGFFAFVFFGVVVILSALVRALLNRTDD